MNHPISQQDEATTLKELGIDSISMVQFKNALNKKLFQDFEVVTLDHINTKIVDLKKHIDERMANNSLIQTDEGVSLTIYEGENCLFCEKEKMQTLEFEEMVLLAEHYNKIYDINMVACKTKDEIIKTIKEFQINPSSDQMGIFFPIHLTILQQVTLSP